MSTTTLTTPSGPVTVNKVAHGLMLMTWKVQPNPDEQSFAAIKAGIDSCPPGVKMFLNGGEFYGPNFGTANIEMISRFFEKYPEYADRAFLSVKGGNKANDLTPDGSEENVKRSVNAVLEKLRGKKKLDLFQCARVDPNTPLEVSLGVLAEFVKEGKIGSIGMSEVKAETLLRGHKVHPITAVEIEVSPWEYGPQQKAVIKAAQENNIAVIAYSPIGRGFLTGQIKSLDDIPEGDFRRMLPRFQPENMSKNFEIVEKLQAIAKEKGITSAQLSIAWVSSLGPHVLPLPGSSHADRTVENVGGGKVQFTSAELAKVNEVIENAVLSGSRYPGSDETMHLWS
ncbi:aldo keto reductase [Coniophora puteana RWD-64-598 SS2]|uniref:Aldo keto reductase n=1 Tax=Coniophora puteana (strain RWD-64-598) TaxID=741705 RepID=A0A5M3N0S7_CONPW|nr:aldo keto reductase [Coniophora puteana RWD-64-598 SS2]EIW85020.1 aldo keto reductase [Coniophora puteana RWD-64-598 SS2]